MSTPPVIKSRKYLFVLIALAAAIAAMFVSRGRSRYFEHEGVVWTTQYHIAYEARHSLNDSIQFILNQMDMSVSPYNKASLITAVNEGTQTRADGYLKRLLEASRAVHKASGGAFDPTVMPLVNAWGFGYKSGTPPTPAQIDSILTFVGMDKISLNGDSIVKADPRVMLDFSSIAKGLAVDEIARMLARNGARSWMVEIGGEVAVQGVNQRGEPWHVSVDMPVSDDEGDAVSHESAVVLTLDSMAVATSGNYRKWRESGGQKISHIIDPRTGSSRAGTLLSVTVVARDCMTADAWATACMVMGDSAVKAMMQPRSDLGVMTISADSAGGALVVWSNKAFANRITVR